MLSIHPKRQKMLIQTSWSFFFSMIYSFVRRIRKRASGRELSLSQNAPARHCQKKGKMSLI